MTQRTYNISTSVARSISYQYTNSPGPKPALEGSLAILDDMAFTGIGGGPMTWDTRCVFEGIVLNSGSGGWEV